MKHISIPIRKRENQHIEAIRYLEDAEGNEIGFIVGINITDDILKAVNSHDALVLALERLFSWAIGKSGLPETCELSLTQIQNVENVLIEVKEV